MLLLAAIRHTLHNLNLSPGDRDYRHVSGATYWLYRLHLTGLAYAVAALAILGVLAISGAGLTPGLLALLVLLVAGGAVQLRWLLRSYREQLQFESVFYDY